MRLTVLGLMASFIGATAELDAQPHPGFRTLELPDGLGLMCRAVSTATFGSSGPSLLAREYRFFVSDGSSAVDSANVPHPSAQPREILAVFDSTGGLLFLTDSYQDSLGGNGWSVARDSTLSYVGASVSVSLESVLRGEESQPKPATRLTTRDSSRVAQLSSWLWQRLCTEGGKP